MTPKQCIAARAVLDLSRQQAASQAGVGVNTLWRFENGLRDTDEACLARLKSLFEGKGAVFLEDDGRRGPGIRFKEPDAVAPRAVGFRKRRSKELPGYNGEEE